MRETGFPVRLVDVRAGYGEGPDVVNGVALEIGAGQAVALLGPNGAGKTTVTRLIAALLKPRSGGVDVGGWDAAARRPDEMARRVGYAFQHADQQLFERSVREDVAFGPRMLGLDLASVGAVLEELGLAAVSGVHPYDLPAPARKLVTLAGVLAMQPGVLLLDEPTAGMDLAMRDVVIAAIRRRAGAGVTVIVVSHDLGFVAEIADRIVVIRGGAVAADAAARDLLTDRAGLSALGLRPPPAAEIGLALHAGGRPVRRAEAVEVLRGVRWR